MVSKIGRKYLESYFIDNTAADMIDCLDSHAQAKALLRYASCKIEEVREEYIALCSDADEHLKATGEMIDEALSLLFGS